LIDPAGNTTTLTYDSNLRITAITDALGRQTTLTYGNPNDIYKITQVTDPFGRFATFSYDASGRLIQIQDVIGIQSKFTYAGPTNFINSLTTPYGTTTFTTSVNGLDRWLSATDPAGDTEVVESNGDQNPAIPFSLPQAPQGLTTEVYYNAWLYYRNSFYWNKKQWKEYPGNYAYAHLYHWLHEQNLSVMGRYLESEQAPLQSRIWYAYPGQSLFVEEGTSSTPIGIGRVIEGGSQLSFQTLNALNLPTSKTDPLGRTTNYQYAANNIDVLSVSQIIQGNPASSVTLASYTWNSQHLPLTYTDAAGQTTNYTYNAHGQVLSVTDALNNTTTFTYYTADAAGKRRNGQLYQIIGALPGNTDVTTFDYDAFGRVATVTGPDGYYLSYTYDALDRATQVTYPDGTTTQTTYLALDPQTTVDRLGRTTSYAYNSLRQLISVTDPLNRTVKFRYCKCGALSQLSDALGRITTWRYDAASRVTSKQYADGSAINYAYEPLSGRLSTVTDEKSQVKTFAYNLDDTHASTTYAHAQVATPNVSLTYDPNFRRMTRMTDGTGTTSYAYYPIAPSTLGAGQLSSETGPLPNATITYTYDALGRRIGSAINGVAETRVLDPTGRVSSITNPLGTFGYTYDGATSRPLNVNYPNGITWAYDYQPLIGDFRLKDITHTLNGRTLLSQHSYVCDVAGRITRWTQYFPQGGINRSWLCGYDNADQLTSVASQDPTTFTNLASGQYGYTYDPAGNRLSAGLDGSTSTAGFNALNQQMNLTSGNSPSLPARTYEWDAENRLTAVNYTGTSGRIQFQYDGIGRRVRITEFQGASVTSDIRFVWRGLALAEARDITGSTVQKRYFGQGMQAITGTAPGSYYYLRDHIGSVRLMADATGAIRAGYDYDAYGRQTKLAGDLDSDFGFTGHYFHQGSALHLALYRAYNAELGRWLSRDPIKEGGGVNLFAYCMNEPINSMDVSGLIPCDSETIQFLFETLIATAALADLKQQLDFAKQTQNEEEHDGCLHNRAFVKNRIKQLEKQIRDTEANIKFVEDNKKFADPKGYVCEQLVKQIENAAVAAARAAAGPASAGASAVQSQVEKARDAGKQWADENNPFNRLMQSLQQAFPH